MLGFILPRIASLIVIDSHVRDVSLIEAVISEGDCLIKCYSLVYAFGRDLLKIVVLSLPFLLIRDLNRSREPISNCKSLNETISFVTYIYPIFRNQANYHLCLN